MSVERVTIAEVREDDMLPGLDNGYVIEVDADHDTRTEYNTALGRGLIMITMNDANGEEFYLIAPPDLPVQVRR